MAELDKVMRRAIERAQRTINSLKVDAENDAMVGKRWGEKALERVSQQLLDADTDLRDALAVLDRPRGVPADTCRKCGAKRGEPCAGNWTTCEGSAAHLARNAGVATAAPAGVHKAMAAEYQDWIDFHAAGRGSFDDFMAQRHPTYGVPGTERVGAEGWKRLAESQQALAETDQRIKEISERYGLDADGVKTPDGGQR